jgi:hypothetical protein
MLPDLCDIIAGLDDRHVPICGRGLVILMDRYMTRDPRSTRPSDLTVTDFHQWVKIGGPPVTSLVQALCDGRAALTAAAGRRLMQTCLAWGCENEVRAACCLAHAPVDRLGTLAPVTIVAALAAVMLWHPARPALRDLLQPVHRRSVSPPTAGRRYPWLQAPNQAIPQRTVEKTPEKALFRP